MVFKKKCIGISMILFMVLGFYVQAQAAPSDPVVMLNQTADNMINALNRNRNNLNHTTVDSLVRRYLVPKVELNTMARSTVPRNVWASADNRTRSQFKQEFLTLVIHTYGAALQSFNDQKVKFYPIRGGYQGKRYIQVDSDILQSGGPNIPVSYRLMQVGSGWKVYDFSVEGVSMVQSYRSQFSSELSSGGNLKTLVNTLKRHNSRRR